MKTNSTLPVGILLVSLWHSPFSAKANVYATNIKLNGATNNVDLASGGTLQISYILNEAATAGVSIDIFSGGTVIRTIAIASGNAGTTRGVNTVTWDGKNGTGGNPSGGTYLVRIKASATGYNVWTQISNDADPGSYVWQPTGLAVNKNTNSPFYGRVFVANSKLASPLAGLPGDDVGILKLNADSSFADEGGFSTGGYVWAGDRFSPWKMQISGDDKLYVNDWTGYGLIFAFDQLVSSNTYTSVLRGDNNPNGFANMSGPAITGTGTNTQIWMADIDDVNTDGRGVLRWTVSADGTLAPNDLGATVVALDAANLNLYPYDIAIDKSNQIYAIQYTTNNADASPRVLRFPAYAGTPETVADWKVGSSDNTMKGAIGVVVDTTATYLAVSFATFFPNNGGSGGVTILKTSDGSFVARMDAGIDMPVVDWDNVGNVYAGDNGDSYWRVYSPPGTNQATTVALETVSVTGPPTLSAPSWSANQFHFTLSGQANQNYTIQSSTNLVNWIPVSTNNSASAVQVINLPAPGSRNFYRALVGP